MSTYDINNLPPSFRNGDIINCSYSGSVKRIDLPTGVYKFECWGATGGAFSGRTNSPGGYSSCKITISANSNKRFYLVCGQSNGAFNGGGLSANTSNGMHGGGATHIATIDGEMRSWTFEQNPENYKQYLTLVAGGSGGMAKVSFLGTTYHSGGAGGGSTGGNGAGDDDYYGYGATQTSGGAGATSSGNGAFGKGGSASGRSGGGGGGGLYGGGGGNYSSLILFTYNGSGGGGSGYIGSGVQEGYTGSPTVKNPDSSGNGYIRITVIEARSIYNINYDNRTLKTIYTYPDNLIKVNYNNSTLVTMGSSNKTLKCGKKKMLTDVVIGDYTLRTAGKVMKTDVVIEVV